MMQRKSIQCGLLLVAGALPAAAAARYAITTDQVAAAVRAGGIAVSPGQVSLMTNVVSSVADPELKLKSIDRAGDERVFARIECATTKQCLPFMVTLRTNVAAQAMAETPQLPPAANVRHTTPLVHAGSTVQMKLEGPHVHITLSVICLQNGAAGQTVHATSLDRKQVYSAQVLNEGVLEGRL